MSGPRVTSGEDSKQDYGTPADLLAAVSQRFGAIQFDLAAHRLNAKHARYFAPANFIEKYDPKDKEWNADSLIASLVLRGAVEEEAARIVHSAVSRGEKHKFGVPNHDENAYAMDAFKQDWAAVSKKVGGLLWLNCEFSDCGEWAIRCASEGARGANGTLLTPASVGANWWIDNLAGVADTYLLRGRLMFDGKNVFPKDCMINHFGPHATGSCFVWDWKRDVLVRSWRIERHAVALKAVP